MNEFEKLIEAARALAHHHAMLSSPDTRWGRKEYEDMRNSITAVESALGLAKVFEGEWSWPDLIIERIGSGAYISLNLAKEMDEFSGKRVRIIVMPEVENGK